jgi:hypothetical protein
MTSWTPFSSRLECKRYHQSWLKGNDLPLCYNTQAASRYLFLWRLRWGNPRRWRRRTAIQGHLHPVALCTYANDRRPPARQEVGKWNYPNAYSISKRQAFRLQNLQNHSSTPGGGGGGVHFHTQRLAHSLDATVHRGFNWFVVNTCRMCHLNNRINGKIQKCGGPHSNIVLLCQSAKGSSISPTNPPQRHQMILATGGVVK